MSAADCAQVHDGFLAAVGGLLLPGGRPVQNRVKEFVHAADRVHLLAAFRERGVHINSGARDAHPHRAEVLENDMHVGGFAEDAHVGQNAVVD